MEDSDSSHGSLRGSLASVLPKGYRFGIHHISTPPTKTDALCSAPPGDRPERTYREQHFLAVSIDAHGQQETQQSKSLEGPTDSSQGREPVLVLGVEIFIYTTARSTTLFVSKADSTGFLHKLDLPKGAPSPIREVCATFIRYLVDQRRRKDIQFVVSLFARAQDQYLFPGSLEYSHKHILDDRGLVKWWCRVLDPLVETPPRGTLPAWKNAKGYLVVPGLDTHETRALFPRRVDATHSWSVDHPLERISHYYREFDWVPPRCLIPRFPDDPKSRFRDELDLEITKTKAMKTTGSWKTVKTLDMFWDMMAFRQECSSGRMTGFIWVVFDDLETAKVTAGEEKKEKEDDDEKGRGDIAITSIKADTPGALPETPRKQRISELTPTTTPRRLFPRKDANGTTANHYGGAEEQKKKKKKKKGKKSQKQNSKKLKGPIIPRQPRIKTKQRNYLLDRPTATAYYFWPAQGRGEKIVDEADYKRILELLLHLDFATMDKAVGSTRRWLSEVGLGSRWGYEVTGTRDIAAAMENGTTALGSGSQAQPIIHNLAAGLVKRKRKDTTVGETWQGAEHFNKVNVLNGGLVRKKHKVQDRTGGAAEESKMEVNSGPTGVETEKEKEKEEEQAEA